jgi:hypothetical protein
MFEFMPAVEMRQSPWHGRFLDRHHEIAYQRWHSAHWIPRLQLVLTSCGVIGLVAFFMGVAGGVALKASMMRAYPDRAWLLFLTRILGSMVPILTAAALCSKRVKDVIVARRLYQGVPLVVFMTFSLLEACPTVWLANSGTAEADEAANEAAEPTPEECSSTTHTRGAYWHATVVDFYAAITGGLFGLRPEFAVVLAILFMALQHVQLEAVWRNSLARRGIEDSEPLVPYFMRVLPLITSLLLSLIQDRGERQEFRAKTLLQLANTERIEQLNREKDRLGWDIRLEQTRPACAVAPGPDAEKFISAPSRSISALSRDGGAAAIASPSPATLTLASADPAAVATDLSSSSASPQQAVGLPLRSESDDRRQVAIQLGSRAAGAAGVAGAAGTAGAAGNGEQARCGRATGILREPRVYTSGAASVGGDSASTDNEIMRILPTNASLGARVPRPLTPGSDKSEPIEPELADAGAGLPKLAEAL